MSSTVTTRFLVISDTHSYDFGKEANANLPFQHPLPKADVLLHCGDLTMAGGLSELKGVIKMLGSIDAELKLVIAGNHDFTLDEPFWRKICCDTAPGGDMMSDENNENLGDHAKAIEIMTGELAKDSGVTYLEEGYHTFTLKNGAKFTLYASPYQPEFCGMAFPYERKEDRFNPLEYVAEGFKSIKGVKVPDFPGVDIMMTHGPPGGILDSVYQGRTMANVGCDALMTAVSRARPQLYCFGHIHEGHGASLVEWKESRDCLGNDAIVDEVKQPLLFPRALKPIIQPGRSTLMVNASIMTVQYKPHNAPWLVDLELSGV